MEHSSNLIMTAKEKAKQLYDYSFKLHGKEKAKQEALHSAIAVRSLAPAVLKEYWDKVIEHLNKN